MGGIGSGGVAANLTGQKFNKLTVVSRSDKMRGRSFLWECSCECGGVNYVTTDGLRSGATKSCGCLRSEVKGRLLSKEQWVEKAEEVHGKRYDYSSVDYKGSAHKVQITCKDHGAFWQSPSDHTNNGAGCKECRKDMLSKKFRLTKDEFITKAREIHGVRFSYENVEYVNSNIKVLITCREHGDFDQTPASHLKGNGCRFCTDRPGSLEQNFELFLKNAKEVHGDKYDYSRVDYVNTMTKVLIGCPIHGFNKQSPGSHLNSNGCKRCGNDVKAAKLLRSQDEYISVVTDIHSESEYNYSKVIYKGNKNKIEVVCKEHGSFFPTAGNHLGGSGCPSCAKSGFSTSKPGILYVLRAGDITKVGITNTTASNRANNVSKESGYEFTVLRSELFKNGLDCLNIETMLLRSLHKIYKNPEKKFPGYSECFLNVDLDDLYSQIERLING